MIRVSFDKASPLATPAGIKWRREIRSSQICPASWKHYNAVCAAKGSSGRLRPWLQVHMALERCFSLSQASISALPGAKDGLPRVNGLCTSGQQTMDPITAFSLLSTSIYFP
jgi:hypothetical protein